MKNLEKFYELPQNSLCANDIVVPPEYTGWIHYNQDSIYKNSYKIYIHHVNGFKQSLNGKPSYIEMLSRNPTKLFRITWHMKDCLHRLDGPATIYCNNDDADEYAINGSYIHIEDYFKHPMVVEYKLESILNHLA